jgi:uncharacterized membrane protein YccC
MKIRAEYALCIRMVDLIAGCLAVVSGESLWIIQSPVQHDENARLAVDCRLRKLGFLWSGRPTGNTDSAWTVDLNRRGIKAACNNGREWPF